MNVKEYERIKRQADDLKAEASKAEGALEQSMSELDEQFDCDSIEAADALMEKLVVERDKAEKAYDKELESFKEEWGERLEGE